MGIVNVGTPSLCLPPGTGCWVESTEREYGEDQDGSSISGEGICTHVETEGRWCQGRFVGEQPVGDPCVYRDNREFSRLESQTRPLGSQGL